MADAGLDEGEQFVKAFFSASLDVHEKSGPVVRGWIIITPVHPPLVIRDAQAGVCYWQSQPLRDSISRCGQGRRGVPVPWRPDLFVILTTYGVVDIENQK